MESREYHRNHPTPFVRALSVWALNLALAAPLAGTAENEGYEITGHVMPVTGAISTGGDYTLESTIGEAFILGVTGDDTAIEGGFRSVVSPPFPPPRPPSLGFQFLTDGSMQLCWPKSEFLWFLEESPSLFEPAWTRSPLEATDAGAFWCVRVESRGPGRFFRLSR